MRGEGHEEMSRPWTCKGEQVIPEMRQKIDWPRQMDMPRGISSVNNIEGGETK